MTMNSTIVALQGGAPVTANMFSYGSGDPTSPGDIGDLYCDLLTQDVWEYAPEAPMSTALSSAFATGTAQWNKVYSLVGSVPPPVTVPNFNLGPDTYDLTLVQGDEREITWFIEGICWTSERPTLNGSPLADPDNESNPLHIGTLPVPWERRFWYSQIRDKYVATVRYRNGWVPWYGTWPNWVWWDANSLIGGFGCTATWDQEMQGTLVTMTMESHVSRRMMAHGGYNWDLESAGVATAVGDDLLAGDPISFNKVKTWLRGKVNVVTDWTIIPV